MFLNISQNLGENTCVGVKKTLGFQNIFFIDPLPWLFPYIISDASIV